MKAKKRSGCRGRRARYAVVALFEEQFQRARTVGEGAGDGTGDHLLEADGQHDIDHAAGNRLVRQVQRGGAAGAIVVDVQHRNAGHADVVQHALAAGGVTEDIARIGLLDRLVANTSVGQGDTNGLLAHGHVGIVLARLDERDHANPGDDDFLTHGSLHRIC
ncbi:hypothetical protein D3C80_1547700 [compost metagenome]